MEDFIQIDLKEFELPKIKKEDILVFTSKNAIKSLYKNYPNIQIQQHNIVCVGKKTEQLLKIKKLQIKHTANSSKKLGEWLVQNNTNQKRILHFCGNIKREELQNIVTKNQLDYSEIEVYHTSLTPKKISKSIHGILFLSPSSVKSFIQANQSSDKVAFCIGNTTANEAKKHFKKVVISNKQSIENSLETIEKYYGNK